MPATLNPHLAADLMRAPRNTMFAPFQVLRHALPYLRQQRSGRIFDIALTVGFQGGNALAVQKMATVSLDLAAWRGASEATDFVE